MNSPIDLTISRQATPGQSDFVRIEAKDHMKVLVRLDIAPDDFLRAVMGQQVIAALETVPT